MHHVSLLYKVKHKLLLVLESNFPSFYRKFFQTILGSGYDRLAQQFSGKTPDNLCRSEGVEIREIQLLVPDKN